MIIQAVNCYLAAGSGGTVFTLTVASGKTASDLSNYPIYVNLADMPSGFWSLASSDGGNVRAYASDGATQVPFDIVKIDTTGHTGSMFIKAATLATASANIFKIKLNGVSLLPATDTYGRNAVWSAFDWVWLGAGLSAGSPEVVDRTGGTAGTIVSGTYSDAPISLGAGCGIKAVTSPHLSWTSRTSRTVFTLGSTLRFDGTSVSVTATALAYATSSSIRMGVGIRNNGSSDAWNVWDDSNSWQGGSPPLTSTTNGIAKRIHAVYNGSTSRKRYIDGAIDDTSGAITARPNTDVDYHAFNNPGGTEPFTGNNYMAFVYARPQLLSADYIAAEYSNINAPSSFYSIT